MRPVGGSSPQVVVLLAEEGSSWSVAGVFESSSSTSIQQHIPSYTKVWKIPEGDKLFCPYALEPTGFVYRYGDAELQLQDSSAKFSTCPHAVAISLPPMNTSIFILVFALPFHLP